MMGTQRLVAMAMAFALMGTSGNGGRDALGMVAQAEGASLGAGAVMEGTTVYEGDRLATGEGGSLRLLAGETILFLKERSSLVVRNGEAKELEGDLVSGMAVLSTPARSKAEIVASTARVRPCGEQRGVVEVRVIGAHELLVFAQRGPSEISYRGETETIAQGKTYRVLLNAVDEHSGQDGAPKRASKRRKALLVILVGAGAAAIIIPTVMRGSGGGVESPERP